MTRRRPVVLILVLLLAACQPAATRVPAPAPSTAAPAASATLQAAAASPAPPTPVALALATGQPHTAAPAATQAPAFPTPGAAGGPTATPYVVKTVIPETDWEEWEVYKQALRPEARSERTDLAGMTQYHLFVEISPDLRSLHGAAYIHYTNRSSGPLDSIYLHLYPNLWGGGMSVGEVQVDGRPAESSLESKDSVLRVALPQPLAPGRPADLSLSFGEPIPDRDLGSYADFSYMNDVLAIAHFYPTVAVYEGGAEGWRLDTPAEAGDVLFGEASLYDVVLTAPRSLMVVATGATLARNDGGDGRATWRLAGGPMRDFNITGSTRFEKSSRQVGDVSVNSYYLPGDAAGGKNVLEWAAGSLQSYESDFGAYPYAELDVVETATSAGGIEYPGLVVIADRYYGDPQQAQSLQGTTAHEVAHQWWYNVVGNDQVNEPWLDEALAQYATYLYFESAYGPRGAQGFLGTLEARWARVNNEEKPIGLPVAAYTPREYGAIVYGRGPLFFLALQDRIGQPAMLDFLRQYYRQYAWRIADAASFQAALEKAAGQDLDPLFAEWVYPKK